MTQADSVLSTPPTNTSAIQPQSSRRSFLVQAAGVAAGGAALGMALPLPSPAATPQGVPDASKAGPALKAAVCALADAHDALEAAKAANDACVAKVERWEADNPKPISKRGIKRWHRKYEDQANAAKTAAAWLALYHAQQAFLAAQMAVAKIHPADQNELCLMAAVATVYDKVKLSHGQQALISYGVALAYFRVVHLQQGAFA